MPTTITLSDSVSEIVSAATAGRDVFTAENARTIANFFESEAYEANEESHNFERGCGFWNCHLAADFACMYIRDFGTGTDMVTRVIRAAFNAMVGLLPTATEDSLCDIGHLLYETVTEVYAIRN